MSTVEAYPHDRKFGVEIECGFPGGWREAQHLFADEGWSIGEDGTDIEVRTPILQGEAGFETLRWAMDRLKANDAFVTDCDGLHIHHDAPEFLDNPELCLHLVRSWRNNQGTIYDMVAPCRRDSGACPSWNDSAFCKLEDWADDSERRFLAIARHDLNIVSLVDYGSVEIRLLEGTLDSQVAISWIQFGQRFLHSVLTEAGPLTQAVSDSDLLSRISLSPEAQHILEAKKLAGHYTPASAYDNGRYDDDDYDGDY